MFGSIPDKTTICPENLDHKTPSNWCPSSSLLEFSEAWEASAEEAAAPTMPSVSRRARILATDDDSSIRALLWEILSANGHELEFAVDGNDAYLKIRAKKYDLVILDVNMPRINGYKLSRQLVAEYKTDRPRILIYTARDIEKEKYQFMECGADEILSKTANVKEMEKIINRLLRLKLETTSDTLAENYSNEASKKGFNLDVQQISTINAASKLFAGPPPPPRVATRLKQNAKLNTAPPALTDPPSPAITACSDMQKNNEAPSPENTENNNPVDPQGEHFSAALGALEAVQKKHSVYIGLLSLAFLLTLGICIFLLLKTL